MIPIAAMAIVLRERVVLVMFVEPAFVIMVIRQRAACAGGDEQKDQH